MRRVVVLRPLEDEDGVNAVRGHDARHDAKRRLGRAADDATAHRVADGRGLERDRRLVAELFCVCHSPIVASLGGARIRMNYGIALRECSRGPLRRPIRRACRPFPSSSRCASPRLLRGSLSSSRSSTRRRRSARSTTRSRPHSTLPTSSGRSSTSTTARPTARIASSSGCTRRTLERARRAPAPELRQGRRARARASRRPPARSIVTMDADLQDDPAEIPNLLAKLDEGYDVVSGWKCDRHDPFVRRFVSRIYNGATRLATGVQPARHELRPQGVPRRGLRARAALRRAATASCPCSRTTSASASPRSRSTTGRA